MKKYLVKAADSRKRNGGIWRARYYFTLSWHLVELEDDVYQRLKDDPDLVVREFKEGTKTKYLENTEFRPPVPPPDPNILINKMLHENTGEEEELEDDGLLPEQRAMIEDAQARAEAFEEENEAEKVLAEIEKKNPSKRPASKRRKSAAKSE